MTWTIDDVVEFAWQRHSAYLGEHVSDPIVASRKFTNVFRVLDRGSQYLLRLMNVYDEVPDRLAVSYLYRQVNRPDTMDDIIAANDGYVPSFDEVTSAEWIRDVVWPVIDARPGSFLNGAYIILIMTNDKRNLKDKMADIFPGARPHLERVSGIADLEGRVKNLQRTPGLGPFLSMQIATDLGYCAGEPDQENDFILPGPGARKGVGYLGHTPGSSANLGFTRQIIQSFPVDEMPTLPGSNGRPPSWMDVQNVFCEFSKYARFYEKGGEPGPRYARGPRFKTHIPKQFVLKKV
ncbi:hypothetical protein FDJ44_gp55 [Microbacterium phage Pikmin]|uniref:5-hmdU DNA kinase helical domain-containing protein n=3 Tax=Pikminvirus pikmin TaxID=2560596 RepID=A0A2P1CKG4_9CAUD|nr:hypothetical protein FDJ44_gp55 [Microbacterium phage Pikmin]AVJ51046.1 hypothetical protein PBI_PAJAZA_55 [Microbacterium phage Pajaza]AVJ51193.1 hypothetical protein PBI_PIKMIN_55 [Microbacterium phage Pikmin]AVJ51751.1 hypothetical protein PBI_CASEY_55 [Microbacterium phage Casey]